MTTDFDRPSPSAKTGSRLDSVDLLRGSVMILMVLDHVRDFFDNANLPATDPARATVPLFFTRWITHFCAPTFVFLAGTGAYLASTRGMTRAQTSRFLLTRGLWLIVLELTVARLGMTFDPTFRFLPLIVLWAIGGSMVALSALVFLPTAAVAAIGVAMIAIHNAFDGLNPDRFGQFADLWRLLHIQGPLKHEIAGRSVFVLYPLVPWIGVMAAGYGFGAIVRDPRPEFRRRVFLALGLGMTLGFVALRAANVYGDPQPWSAVAPEPRADDRVTRDGPPGPPILRERGPTYVLLSFLNCQKYPPSLLYLLMTLGPAIASLALFDRGAGWIGRPVATLGRVPLFYYLLQWPLIHLLAIAYNAIRGQPYRWLLGGGGFQAPPDYGYGLAVVYAMWIVTVLLLYVPCRWFADLKRRRRDPWLSYF